MTVIRIMLEAVIEMCDHLASNAQGRHAVNIDYVRYKIQRIVNEMMT
jgi:hypothetical protein